MKTFEYIETCIVAKYELEVEGKWKLEGILQTKLNEFGSEGWELVFIRKIVTTKNRDLYTVIFKREIEA